MDVLWTPQRILLIQVRSSVLCFNFLCSVSVYLTTVLPCMSEVGTELHHRLFQGISLLNSKCVPESVIMTLVVDWIKVWPTHQRPIFESWLARRCSNFLFCFCDKAFWPKATWEFIWLVFPSHYPSLRKVGAGKEARTWSRNNEQCTYCFTMFSCLSCTAQTHLPRDSVTHSGLGPPT